MPTCPGCQQRLPYDQLDTHYRYCDRLTGEDDAASLRRLESRVDDVERELDGRLRAVEVRIGTDAGSGGDELEGRLIEPER